MKSVVITGATRGLGLAITKKLIDDEYFVIAIGRTPSEEFEQLIQNAGEQRLLFLGFDLANLSEIRKLSKIITTSSKDLYGLINNAAVGADGILATMHESDISRGISLNLHSPILLTKYMIRPMLLAGRGRIINISSITAHSGYNGLSVYGATKSGLIGFTRSLARELGKANITVNSVSPGFMETEMTADLKGDKLDTIRRRTSMKELVQPFQVAELVSFLLRDSSSAITGSNYIIDAGSTA